MANIYDSLASQIMAEVEALQASLSEQDKIKLMLQNAKGRLIESGRRRDACKRDVAAAKAKLTGKEKAREDLFRGFETTITALQSKTDRKNLMLSKRLDGYEQASEGCESRIEQMVQAMELDRPACIDVLRNTAALVQSADENTADQKFTIARGVKV